MILIWENDIRNDMNALVSFINLLYNNFVVYVVAQKHSPFDCVLLHFFDQFRLKRKEPCDSKTLPPNPIVLHWTKKKADQKAKTIQKHLQV